MKIPNSIYGDITSLVTKLLAAFFLLAGLSAHGEIYKWTDEQGRVHFSDKAPERGVVESISDQLKINSYQGTEVTTTDFLNQRDADRREKERLNRPRVVMYSAVWCASVHGSILKAKKFLSKNTMSKHRRKVKMTLLA